MPFGINEKLDSATRAQGNNGIMYNHDRALPKVLPSSLGSAPFTTAQVWKNDDSGLWHIVYPSVHSQNNTLDDSLVVTTVAFYLINEDDVSVTAADRIFRIPLVASESAEVGTVGIALAPGDVLLAVDEEADGVVCRITAMRQI